MIIEVLRVYTLLLICNQITNHMEMGGETCLCESNQALHNAHRESAIEVFEHNAPCKRDPVPRLDWRADLVSRRGQALDRRGRFRR